MSLPPLPISLSHVEANAIQQSELPELSILQTDNISDFREFRHTKEGNHKGLPLHARENLWTIPVRKRVAKKTEKLTVSNISGQTKVF